MSCHEAGGHPAGEPEVGHPGTTRLSHPHIVLVGPPNAGKSTLFNLLTGARQKTMNAPRTTVSLEVGRWKIDSRPAQLVDLPGTYSLIPQSPDEEVTSSVVAGRSVLGAPVDLAIVVIDANALSSSTYLLAQVAALGMPVVVAVSMLDLVQRAHGELDLGMLRRKLGVPVVAVNPRRGEGAQGLSAAVSEALAERAVIVGLDLAGSEGASGAVALLSENADRLFDWTAQTLAHLQGEPTTSATRSDQIDRILLNPWIGVPIFLAVLWGIFQLTTKVAGPIQDFFEGLITGPLTDAVLWLLHAVNLNFAWLDSFVVDGVMAGVGVVVSFLPLMVIIFAAIAVLEDSGYMARVAFLADRVMRKVGLDGRAVLPLVIGFGCNIPALAATKTLPNARQRVLTGLLVPYASCTARLVIYLLLASIFFPQHAGTVVFAMYLVSVLVMVLVGFALKHTAFRGMKREPLVLALPPYQVPRMLPLLRSILVRCRSFIIRAGQVIVLLTVVVWALMWIPISGGHSIGDELKPQESVFGAVSEGIAPVFAPAGFDDWHLSASLITGFVAKEAVVGTLASTYGMSEPEDPSQPGDLSAQLRATFERSSGGHGSLAAIAYMVFCLIYTPCLATVGEQRRVLGGKITALSVVGSLLAAWVIAVILFQVGALL